MLCKLLLNKQTMQQIFREFDSEESLAKFKDKFLNGIEGIIDEKNKAESDRWKKIEESTEILNLLKERGLTIDDLHSATNINRSRCLDTKIPIHRKLTHKLANLGTLTNPKYNGAFYNIDGKLVNVVHRLEPSSLRKDMVAVINATGITRKEFIHNAKQLFLDLEQNKDGEIRNPPNYIRSQQKKPKITPLIDMDLHLEHHDDNADILNSLDIDQSDEGESQLLFLEPKETAIVDPVEQDEQVTKQKQLTSPLKQVIIADLGNVVINTDKKISLKLHYKAIDYIRAALNGKMNFMKLKGSGHYCLNVGQTIRIITEDKHDFRIMDVKTFNKL